MKRFAALFLCLICLLSLVGCGKNESAAEEPEPLPVQAAGSLVYDNGSATLRFSYEGDKWTWADGPSFPLDSSTVQEILTSLSEFFAQEPKARKVDPASCGLSEPSRYLTITGEEEKQTFYFGAQATDGSWYICREGEDAVYMIPNDFMLLLNKGIYDMAILPTLPELTEENVIFIGISQGEEKQTYFLKTEDTWKTNGKDTAAKAQKILQELANLELLRCVDYFPSNGVAELCGLTENATEVTVKYTNSVGTESEFIVTLGGEMETDTGRYITVGDSAAIYCLPKDGLKTLLSLL